MKQKLTWDDGNMQRNNHSRITKTRVQTLDRRSEMLVP